MGSGKGPRRFAFGVYAAELSIGVVAGLALFLFLLFLLQQFFPDATGLGELVRSRRSSAAPGSVQSATVADTAPLAMLTEIHKDVRGKLASSVIWSVAEQGAALGDGDAVQSYDGSSATITFDEHNALELGERSLIVLRRPRARAQSTRRRAAVLFMDGFLRGKLGGGSVPLDLEVLAGGGIVRPRDPGGKPVEITLSLDKDAAALAASDGDVEVVWNDRVTVVPSGTMVTFDGSQAPSAPIALPKPPIPVLPADGESFHSRAAPPRVSFAWRPADETPEFTLQIARDPSFSKIVFERTQRETSFVHGALPAGDYYWRIRGRRASIDGAESRTSRFTIDSDQRLPLLRVQFPSERVSGRSLVIRGETEPGCRIIIGDVTVPSDASGRFEHTLDLRAGYNFVVVQAVDAVGNTAFESRTIIAESLDSERKP